MQPAPAHISYGSQIFAWVRNAPAFWQWFAFLFPATTAAVTSVIARLQDVPVPWHLVIFYSLGVFCFAIFATVTLIKMKWEMTLKYKLTCDDFKFEILNEGGNRVGVILNAYFNNLSTVFPIQYTVRDISLLLQNKGNNEASDHFEPHSIAPSGFSPVGWPIIHDLDIKNPIKGTLKFAVDYGVPGEKNKRQLIQKMGIDLMVTRTKDKFFTLQMIGIETMTYL